MCFSKIVALIFFIVFIHCHLYLIPKENVSTVYYINNNTDLKFFLNCHDQVSFIAMQDDAVDSKYI